MANGLYLHSNYHIRSGTGWNGGIEEMGDCGMRTIKFRAWDKEYNVMVQPDDIHPKVTRELITGDGKVMEITYRHSYTDTEVDFCDISDSRILMQFTGLHDKNGVEIYEGDIIRNDRGTLLTAIFEDGCFVVDGTDILSGRPVCSELRAFSRWSEVIGNIYENPEILEQTT